MRKVPRVKMVLLAKEVKQVPPVPLVPMVLKVVMVVLVNLVVMVRRDMMVSKVPRGQPVLKVPIQLVLKDSPVPLVFKVLQVLLAILLKVCKVPQDPKVLLGLLALLTLDNFHKAPPVPLVLVPLVNLVQLVPLQMSKAVSKFIKIHALILMPNWLLLRPLPLLSRLLLSIPRQFALLSKALIRLVSVVVVNACLVVGRTVTVFLLAIP